ncbi:MAG: helix-turn-helix domain-containing protein [Pseudomonadota bacterium]|nr:helix-turn-helix domain-containing protein [Pseudomonadota bacterium]
MTPDPTLPDRAVLTLKEAAAYARISYSKAAELARYGYFPAYRLPGCAKWLVSRRALLAWLNDLLEPAYPAAAALEGYDRLLDDIHAA